MATLLWSNIESALGPGNFPSKKTYNASESTLKMPSTLTALSDHLVETATTTVVVRQCRRNKELAVDLLC